LRSKRIVHRYSHVLLVLAVSCLSMIGCGGGKSASGPPNPGPTPSPTPAIGSASLTATPSSLGFGTQPLNTPVTLTVKVTNIGTAAATITQDSVTGPGFSSGITTPVTLNPAQSVNIPVVFTPSASGSVAGSLTLTSSNGTSILSVPLSGTGLAPLSHSVDVAWDPSTSPTLQGYNVYRGTASGGPYTRISATLSPTTLLFTDTTPLSGRSYFYVVTAVDTSGAESAASAEVTVTIPTP
jgi:Cep192 domain 4